MFFHWHYINIYLLETTKKRSYWKTKVARLHGATAVLGTLPFEPTREKQPLPDAAAMGKGNFPSSHKFRNRLWQPLVGGSENQLPENGPQKRPKYGASSFTQDNKVLHEQSCFEENPVQQGQTSWLTGV